MIIIKFFNEESLITAKGAFHEGPQETNKTTTKKRIT